MAKHAHPSSRTRTIAVKVSPAVDTLLRMEAQRKRTPLSTIVANKLTRSVEKERKAVEDVEL